MSSSYETEIVTLKANITKSNLSIFLLHTILKHLVYLKEQIPTYVFVFFRNSLPLTEKNDFRRTHRPLDEMRFDDERKRILQVEIVVWCLERERD